MSDNTCLACSAGVDCMWGGRRAPEGAQTWGTTARQGHQAEGLGCSKQPLHEPEPWGTQWYAAMQLWLFTHAKSRSLVSGRGESCVDTSMKHSHYSPSIEEKEHCTYNLQLSRHILWVSVHLWNWKLEENRLSLCVLCGLVHVYVTISCGKLLAILVKIQHGTDVKMILASVPDQEWD